MKINWMSWLKGQMVFLWAAAIVAASGGAQLNHALLSTWPPRSALAARRNTKLTQGIGQGIWTQTCECHCQAQGLWSPTIFVSSDTYRSRLKFQTQPYIWATRETTPMARISAAWSSHKYFETDESFQGSTVFIYERIVNTQEITPHSAAFRGIALLP